MERAVGDTCMRCNMRGMRRLWLRAAAGAWGGGAQQVCCGARGRRCQRGAPLLRRLLRRLLASLDHPNIISYYEAFCDHDQLCVVTELVMGGDLGSFIRWVHAITASFCMYMCI